MVYSKRPDSLSTTTDTIELDDEYKAVIVNYVVYRAFSEEIDSAASLGLAQSYYSLFKEAVVARRLGRDFITVELNQKYIDEHIKPRIEETNPLFGSVEVV